MSGHGDYLRQLLAPLRVYRLEGTANGGELDAQGAALDAVMARLEDTQKEMLVSTAEGRGLEAVEALLARKPVADSLKRRREALAALLRIGGDSFTLAAINDTISGCGIPARVEESGGQTVTVSFPGTAGVPEDFQRLKKIVEDILPPHLDVLYRFWYLTWGELEERGSTWAEIEEEDLTWEGLASWVE